MKRIDLTPDQKAEALKLFCKSERLKQLIEDFRKSFKVLEGRASKGDDPTSFIIWSSVTQRTMEVSTSELLGEGGK